MEKDIITGAYVSRITECTRRYVYEGPVTENGKCAALSWFGATVAESESEARSKLASQYKEIFELMPNVEVELTGRIFALSKLRMG